MLMKIIKVKCKIDSELAVLQIDFAENFSTLWQDEVQSAHWNKKQITAFTSVTWQQDSCTTAVIISDELTHSRNSIIMIKLLTSILDKNIKKLHIWSDGPSSQFKNRFIAASISWLQKRHTLKIYWNYFATSHGKGPVDGIGGTIKRMAAQKVIRREVNTTNAESFYEAINGESNVKMFLVKAEEIRNAIETHLHAVISTAPVLPGIFSAHYLQHEDGTTNMKPYSTASYNVNQLGKTNSETSEVIEIVIPKVVEDVRVGSFIIVTYDFASASSSKYVTKKLVAMVTNHSKEDNAAEVEYTTAISKRRVKITSAEKGQIGCSNIVRLLPYPALKRGAYEFEEDRDIDTF